MVAAVANSWNGSVGMVGRVTDRVASSPNLRGMVRRLTGVAICAFSLEACGSPPPSSRTSPAPMAAGPTTFRQTDLSPRERARHVLNRLAYGPRPGDVD